MARTGLGRQNTSAKTLTGNGSCELRTTSPSRTGSWNRGASPSTDTNARPAPRQLTLSRPLTIPWSSPGPFRNRPRVCQSPVMTCATFGPMMTRRSTQIGPWWKTYGPPSPEAPSNTPSTDWPCANDTRHRCVPPMTGVKANGRPSPPELRATPGRVFSEGSATDRSILENSAFGNNVGDPVAATDADGDTLTYTLGGADAAYHSI